MKDSKYVKVEVQLTNSGLDFNLSNEDKQHSLTVLKQHLEKGFKIPLYIDKDIDPDWDIDILYQLTGNNFIGLVFSIEEDDGIILANIECKPNHVDTIKNGKLQFTGRIIGIDSDFALGIKKTKPEFKITGVLMS